MGKNKKIMFKLFQPKWQVDEAAFPTLLSDIKSITVISFEDEQEISLSKNEITAFLVLFRKGSFKNMFKCATSYEIEIKHSGGFNKILYSCRCYWSFSWWVKASNFYSQK